MCRYRNEMGNVVAIGNLDMYLSLLCRLSHIFLVLLSKKLPETGVQMVILVDPSDQVQISHCSVPTYQIILPCMGVCTQEDRSAYIWYTSNCIYKNDKICSWNIITLILQGLLIRKKNSKKNISFISNNRGILKIDPYLRAHSTS